ncbi:MAG TPA: phosphosulfolactate synthase [Bacteroidales bacterium]|nr:phosphosulfolactate synthase [Bacteroidales bacterium]HPS17744.1 phosphosulfolactate synthase [Bacteroidales bacterium]
MKNNILNFIPERPSKPRKKGVNMMMDKGLSIREVEDFISVAGEYTDFAKLGFGTSMVMNGIIETKIKLYKEANIKVYLGGTLFEAFIIRDKLDEYKRLIDKLKVDAIEVSDGSILMDHDVKCNYISQLSKTHTVLSEVGSKEAGIITAPNKWIQMMQSEIDAGSSFVIAEARESGTVGIYRPNGNAHVSLVTKITSKIDKDKILWEAPLKSQQVWFIKEFGCNVNLGNIAPNEIIPLETLRIGLRGDTFFQFLPDEFQKLKIKPKAK